MKKLFVLAGIVLVLSALQSMPPTKLLIVSDTNRDGKIVIADDLEDRNAWTAGRGAVFMFNNDSDQGGGRQDCADRKVNGPADLLDLAPVVIGRLPGAADGDRLRVSLSESARPFVNIFYKNGGDYIFIENEAGQELPARLLKDGDVELRVEANSYAFPGWDGTVDIAAVLQGKDGALEDSVRLKVAPFVMLSAVRKAERIYVRDYPGKNEAFIRSLKDVTSKLGIELKIVGPESYPVWEVWLQDIMEIGFSQTPLQGQHVVFKSNRGRPLDDMPEKEMLGPDHGWFKWSAQIPETSTGRGGDSWLDWYGNLEVTPPLPGKPLGRIFYGYNKQTGRSLNPEIAAMLEAQGVQAPLIKIHTGWLLIKHVDEVFNFVPAKGGMGFRLLVPDAQTTFRLLDQWVSEGKGGLPLLKGLRPNATVSSLAADGPLRDFNLKLQKEEIEFSIDEMMTAAGLAEADLIRIPALFVPEGKFAPALMPNMVNSVHMNGHQLMADPRGPVDGEKDLIQEYVRGLLGKEGIEVHFVDDFVYHKWSGNVHCGTNVAYSFRNRSSGNPLAP